MSIVTIKNKYQVVIPQSLCRQVWVNVGDLFEASVEKGKITLTPKVIVDREIAEGLEDVKQGRVHGPYNSASSMTSSLHRMASLKSNKVK